MREQMTKLFDHLEEVHPDEYWQMIDVRLASPEGLTMACRDCEAELGPAHSREEMDELGRSHYARAHPARNP
jgi:hypothetical protein